VRSHGENRCALPFLSHVLSLTAIDDGPRVTIGPEHVRVVAAANRNTWVYLEIAGANTRAFRVSAIWEPRLSVSMRTNARSADKYTGEDDSSPHAPIATLWIHFPEISIWGPGTAPPRVNFPKSAPEPLASTH